ncbi:MAG: tRNA (adenosine(37)-N6)-threonylcarbamoyltransferase complex ATPase subunit type 1 TsaE [Desulfobacteraceae bacterium]|nr:tRNA (adenosine(37)-N6)-threonylcarbamoyltransferase complex ATPase subunit type 1 TsaE [Desulfobacteraceae bacterium]
MVVHSHSAARTEEIGRTLGTLLHSGAFLALFGDLGGGKTCFTRGVVAALSPDSAHLVASPTYAIMNEYPGPIPVYHFDFYRLGSGDEIAELGFDDYFQDKGVCIAEWSERLGDTLPSDHLSITFLHEGPTSRRMLFEARGAISRLLLSKLAARLNAQEFL